MNPIASARLRTAETFSFKYGRVEIKAKLPKGDWYFFFIFIRNYFFIGCGLLFGCYLKTMNTEIGLNL